MSVADAHATRARRRRGIRVRGTVQGVGFRPAMYRLARSLHLTGFVRNDGGEVWMEVEGTERSVARFVESIAHAAPPLAHIDAIDAKALAAANDHVFAIAPSACELDGQRGSITPDSAPCSACLAELDSPQDRRYRYPFSSCTSCGPRFTVVRALPYDRKRTTLVPFPLCAACEREYRDPEDRRYHAEVIACPDCGPQLEIEGRPGLVGERALEEAARALGAGGIVAVKGAGGFALAVDATNESAVARLRERKRRPDKPFAVMVASPGEAERLAQLDAAGRRALQSGARPIVLAPARPDNGLAPSVAPGVGDVGVFLPPTPLQHLLLRDGPPTVVMTSGNASGEPIAQDNRQARERLSVIADVIVSHDREICARADDSVVRIVGGDAVAVRRARGYVPAPIEIPIDGPPVLAVGGQHANTVGLAASGRAIASAHIGDLDHPNALSAFEEAIDHLRRLTGIEPVAVAFDRHPDYRATRWALACGLPGVAVQHHHAHVAACMADNGHADPVVGIAFDGTGYGDDGGVWGGEVLWAGFGSSRRLGHLRPIALLGGEAAIREPWRLALAALLDAGQPPDLLARIDERRMRLALQILDRAVVTRATGAGRYFDAVASLCGVRDASSYDGQAAIELESLAAAIEAEPYAFHLEDRGEAPFEIDLRPAIRDIARDLRGDVPAPVVSARFHETLAAAIARAWSRARALGAPKTAALAGGCFQNRRLVERATARLEREGAEVLRHRDVPAGDGGLCVGQACVASHSLRANAAAGRPHRGMR